MNLKHFENPLKIGQFLVGAVVLVSLVFGSYFTVGGGEYARVQNNITGSHHWYTTQGIHLKVPFFSDVTFFSQVTTIAVTDDEQIADKAGVVLHPLMVTFADNYGGKMSYSFRVKLPTDPSHLEMIYQDTRSSKNLYGTTYRTFASNMLNLTTDQFLAQDFMQGGKGAFKQRIMEQAQHGMLVTSRKRVKVNGNVADQTLSGDRSQTKDEAQYITKVVIETDKHNAPLRREYSLQQYGIEVLQADDINFVPNPDLIQYITKIKEREVQRGEIVARQQLERDSAVTEQLTGERERITAKNKLLREKDQAVIAQQKQTAVEKERAKLEVVKKNKELAIARANLGIEKANSAAAKYSAQAIKEKGFAEAAVEKAKYAAVDKDVLRLRVREALGKALYSSKMTVKMPMIVGGASGNVNSLDNMSSLKLLQMLGQEDPTESK